MDNSGVKLVLSFVRSYYALCIPMEKNIRQFGLTVSEFGVLEALLHKGDLPVQKLGRIILVTSGSMTYIVNKLEKRGYVEKYQCRKDGRIWYVKLTDQGYRFISRIFPEHEKFLNCLLSEIPQEKQKKLIKDLLHFRRIINHTAGPDSKS
ncbi:MAG TPA: MarR family transcriptional regulator [Veillonellaceae bacterium]|jgi:MarR family 2-MHQ and catechol resistance regulon transcriptional repressor|nr:MarR family transcriptional regulator [Veillonellaceae bacterium]